MRLRPLMWLSVLLLVLLAMPFTVSAQGSPNIEWNRWDAQIAVQPNSDQLQIAETQEVRILNGSIRQGTRFWTNPVQVQAVYVVLNNGQNPTQLQASSNGQPGTYTVSQASDRTTLTYNLPTSQQAGNTFTVQINYTTTSPTSGMVDWKAVPAEHAFDVRSSTVRIRFPEGGVPDQSLVRISNGQGTVSVNGNEVVIQSSGPIAAQQPFAIQVPFGPGVGAAGNNNNPANPNNNPAGVPSGDNGTAIQLPGLGTILVIICVVGFLLLVGGGSLLRALLGGFLGGGVNRGGGIFPPGPPNNYPGGGYFGGDNEPQQPGGVNRGFRPSANQERNVGRVGNDKESGGGASFR